MPNLMFSPFLPLSQQIETQKQLEFLDSNMNLPVSSFLGTNDPLSYNVGPEESFQRLNSDLPPQHYYPEDAPAPQ